MIEATNKPGLYNNLEALHRGLVVCEKALNDYLETKRLAYPRFYFVSSADLLGWLFFIISVTHYMRCQFRIKFLDILSNGNFPELVCKHLIKLYDSLAKLVFSKNNEERNSSLALEMISKENNEHVVLKTPCDCSGKVN